MASLATQFQAKGESCDLLLSVYLKEHKDKKTFQQVRGRLKDGFCDKATAQNAIAYRKTFNELYKQAPGNLSGDLWTQVGPLVQWELDQTKENSP